MRKILFLGAIVVIVVAGSVYMLVQTRGSSSPKSFKQAASAKCRMQGQLPDSKCTPGTISPIVTQANLQDTICKPGYSKNLVPPAKYLDTLKRQQLVQYGFREGSDQYKEAFLVPIELGGSPLDPKNLWPEPKALIAAKNKTDASLHDAVCNGKLTLKSAQQHLMKHWITAADKL